ncbi:MAG: hypothetical protein P8J87_11520, partial [Verrucomicrobiales bacterium]|nr:hypothetical protein [Verrucomicrobiales bacterium]
MRRVLTFGAAVFLAGLASGAAETLEVPPLALPYADVDGGRENYRYGEHPVNGYRLYDFYARQADYYIGEARAGKVVPDLLPAFPGLEGGVFGHWGKYSQNDHVEDRWNRMEVGNVVAGAAAVMVVA